MITTDPVTILDLFVFTLTKNFNFLRERDRPNRLSSVKQTSLSRRCHLPLQPNCQRSFGRHRQRRYQTVCPSGQEADSLGSHPLGGIRVESLTAKVPPRGNYEFSGDPGNCQQGQARFCKLLFRSVFRSVFRQPNGQCFHMPRCTYLVEMIGLEPTTPGLQSRCSPN